MIRRWPELTCIVAALACARSVVVTSAPGGSAAPAPAPAPPPVPAPRDSVPPAPAPVATPPAAPAPVPAQGGTRSADAELPRVRPEVPEGLDTRPCTVKVKAGLQAALQAARGGDVLCLAPGTTFTGNFQVASRPDAAGWVVLRTDPAVSLGAGRMRPSQAGRLARLASPNTQSVLRFGAGAARWLVLGVELTSDSTIVQGPVNLVEVGTTQERTLAALPGDIAFDRVYAHGWPQQHMRRAFAANGRAFTLVRSWCTEVHASGFDSQCVISWAGAGPMLVEDNTLAAASENLMFGGADPRVPGLVPSDITIRRNHVTKLMSWKGARWNVKNLIETKASARVLVEDNVLEQAWTDGQTGYAFVLKSTSQGGTCRPCSSSDWTIRRNLVRHTGAGFSIAGRADQHITGPTDSTNRRFFITENWIEPVNVAPFVGDGRLLTFVAENQEITITRNVFEPGGQVRSTIIFDISGAIKVAVRHLVLANNVFPRGEYGVGATSAGEGARAWQVGAVGGSTWGRNAFIGNSTIPYPPGTTFHATLAQALGAAGVSRKALDAAVAGVVVDP